jgi:hypothetical protein
MARSWFHYAFEDPAEHVGSDAGWVLFIDGKMEALEEPGERITPRGVGDVSPMPPL